jgi:hypothetical protein
VGGCGEELGAESGELRAESQTRSFVACGEELRAESQKRARSGEPKDVKRLRAQTRRKPCARAARKKFGIGHGMW